MMSGTRGQSPPTLDILICSRAGQWLQVYDNFIHPLTECFRMVGNMSRDILTCMRWMHLHNAACCMAHQHPL
jgi:hypothetical protein